MDFPSSNTKDIFNNDPRQENIEDNMKCMKLSQPESWFSIDHPARIMGIMSMMPFLFQSHQTHFQYRQTMNTNNESSNRNHFPNRPTNFSIESILNWSKSNNVVPTNNKEKNQINEGHLRSQLSTTYLLKSSIDHNDAEHFYNLFQHYSTENEVSENLNLKSLNNLPLPSSSVSKNSCNKMIKRRPINRGPRIPFTPNQVQELENKFNKTQYLSSLEVNQLAKRLNLSDTRVRIWFQNRRAREKREHLRVEPEDQKKTLKIIENSNDFLTNSELSTKPSSPLDSKFDTNSLMMIEEMCLDNNDEHSLNNT